MEKKTIFDLGRDTVEQYRARRKLPLTVVLNNVRSLNNIGAIFRTSDAFLVDRIFLCGITATPPSPEIHKTALGAEDSVAWEYFEATMDAVERLRREGALKKLKGLLYFTDGKGIYPVKKPDYKTAFLFLDDFEEENVPVWAIRMRLEEEEFKGAS